MYFPNWLGQYIVFHSCLTLLLVIHLLCPLKQFLMVTTFKTYFLMFSSSQKWDHALGQLNGFSNLFNYCSFMGAGRNVPLISLARSIDALLSHNLPHQSRQCHGLLAGKAVLHLHSSFFCHHSAISGRSRHTLSSALLILFTMPPISNKKKRLTLKLRKRRGSYATEGSSSNRLSCLLLILRC